MKIERMDGKNRKNEEDGLIVNLRQSVKGSIP